MTDDQPDSDILLNALHEMVNLSVDPLWMAVCEQMSTEVQAECAEFAAHIEAGENLMPRKSQAMKYLVVREYKVSFDDLKLTDE